MRFPLKVEKMTAILAVAYPILSQTIIEASAQGDVDFEQQGVFVHQAPKNQVKKVINYPLSISQRL